MLARILELEILRGQLGVEEGPVNNTGERVEEYQRTDNIAGEHYAWCVDFGLQWGYRLATGARRVKNKAGEIVLKGGEVVALGTASCWYAEQFARAEKWIVTGKPRKADKMILAGDVHFTTIEKVLKLVAGLLYVVTIEGNTTSYDALSTTPHNRDGVYRKRRIVRRSSVTILRIPGRAIVADPLAKEALARLQPKAAKLALPDVLRAKKGVWSWIHWSLGDGMWKGYYRRDKAVRPNFHKRATKKEQKQRAEYAKRKSAKK